jgi:hypothetical protein
VYLKAIDAVQCGKFVFLINKLCCLNLNDVLGRQLEYKPLSPNIQMCAARHPLLLTKNDAKSVFQDTCVLRLTSKLGALIMKRRGYFKSNQLVPSLQDSFLV